MTLGRSKQAKARKLSQTVSYRVALIGNTWQGYTGTYDYRFDHEPTEQEVKATAGDFQLVNDYETMRETRITYSDGDRRIFKVVRPWQSEESIDIYCDANGC